MSEPTEVEYRDIPGFPGYRAGSNGTIWSRWRTCRQGKILTDHWHQMKLSVQKKRSEGRRYLYLNLCRDGKPTTFHVHRLILLAFVGPRPEGMECRHLDGNPANNNITNLTWGTKQENTEDCRKHNRYHVGEKHPRSKLTTEQVIEIRRRYATNKLLLRELAEEFNVNIANISTIIKRKSWKHLD